MGRPVQLLRLPEADWMVQALCADHPKVSFFDRDSTEAKAICQECPVRPLCLEYALATPLESDHGVWGGTSRAERRRMRAAA